MTRIRFRTDSCHWAERALEIENGGDFYDFEDAKERASIISTPRVRDGDCWVIRWALTVDQKAAGMTEGPVAGYAIACPGCHQIHRWTSANNCGAPRREYTYEVDGVEHKGSVCIHSGTGSCWQWSGSAEAGTLTASPSLHCVESLGGCGWHGWLQNGVLRHC